MSDAEIEQAIRDAELYAEQDKLRKNCMEIQNIGLMTINKAENALKKAGKKLDKEEKKQVKADIAQLRKLLSKLKPEKAGDQELADINAAIARLEASSAHACMMAETAAPEDAEDEDNNNEE